MSDTEIQKKPKSTDLVGSLVHGLNTIMAFDRDTPQMTLSQVAEKTGMNRAGARRYLLTLVDLGFVEQNERLFRLTPKVMELGYSYLSSVPLSENAQYYLDKIRDEAHMPVALGILDGEEIVHIASANTQELVSPNLTIGRRFPLAYASAGRAILAAMPEEERNGHIELLTLQPTSEKAISTKEGLKEELKHIAEKGYALVDQEMQIGIRSLAVPILTRGGKVVASFNTFTLTNIVSEDRLLNHALPILQHAAQEIGHTLT